MSSGTCYLILASSTVGNVFFHMPQSMALGYSNDLEPNADKHRTHPPQHLYKGGKVKPFSFELPVHVGVSPGINTPEQLLGLAQRLQDMALPPGNLISGGAVLGVEPLTVVCQGQSEREGSMAEGGGTTGKIWFRARAFLTDLGLTFTMPIVISSGLYHHCDVRLELTPTYAKLAAKGSFAEFSALPHRPWMFSKQG